MTNPAVAEALAEACQQIPDALAGVCADLRSGNIIASEIGPDSPTGPAELAAAAARLFAGGAKSGLNHLWRRVGDGAEGGDEVVLLDPDHSYVFFRPAARPHYALVFLTGRDADVGLTIARTRAVKARFEDALRRP